MGSVWLPISDGYGPGTMGTTDGKLVAGLGVVRVTSGSWSPRRADRTTGTSSIRSRIRIVGLDEGVLRLFEGGYSAYAECASYSSLAYLQKLPVDGVKIDRSFVTPLLDCDNTSAIVRAAIQLSHALGLDIVAEGLEDDAALRLLTEMGCDGAQGYLIARHGHPSHRLAGQ